MTRLFIRFLVQLFYDSRHFHVARNNFAQWRLYHKVKTDNFYGNSNFLPYFCCFSTA